MRLIDADVLLEKVREIRKLALDRAVETPANMPFPIYQNPAYTRYSTQADEREKFKAMIEEAPSVQSEQRWIPVTEALPEVKQAVLVTTKNGQRDIRKCIDAGHLKWFYNDIIAWMPSPEPYQERGE